MSRRLSIDLDDTRNCPVADMCGRCGRSDQDDLEVSTFGSMLGVWCQTLCLGCEQEYLDGWAGRASRSLGVLDAMSKVGEHCEHLGINLDQMALAGESSGAGS